MLKRLWKQEEGQVLVMAALLMAVLLGFAALVIDVGYFYMEKRQLQTAVDAAALAGAIVADKEKDTKSQVEVEKEVDKYLTENIEASIEGRVVETKWEDPITVTVDLTTAYPAFFSRVFGNESTNIYAHAKSQIFDRELESSPYSVFAETVLVTYNGNDGKIEGDVYSYNPPNIDLTKVTISGELQDASDYNGNPPKLPDYSSVLTMPATTVTESYFQDNYINGPKEVDGLIIITTDKSSVHLKKQGSGIIKGKGIIYSVVNLDIDVDATPESSILYYSGKNINLSSSQVFGTVYAPNGSIDLNGDKNIPIMGRLLAKNSVTLNGAQFRLGYNAGAEDWMDVLSKISKLIE